MAILLMSENLLKENTLVKKIAVLFSLTLVFALAGCNTVKGVGQDVQKAGSVIEDSVKKK